MIVAARNEELHIEKCIRSLLQQDYPSGKYTITVVDDQSTNRTGDIVRQLAIENSAVELLQLHGNASNISPIINAINEAIKKTSSEIILRTDADCVVGHHWISSMVRHFDENVGVISGLTLIKDGQNIPPFLFGFQSLDLFSQTACGAGAIGMNAPINCNGSNMGFRRAAFHDVGGFESMATINSGSDSLLAQRIAATTRWKMRFAYEPETHVTTLPVSSWTSASPSAHAVGRPYPSLPHFNVSFSRCVLPVLSFSILVYADFGFLFLDGVGTVCHPSHKIFC